MKIKPIKNEKELYNIARYNKNVKGNHLEIIHGLGNLEKKRFAALSMLTIIDQSGMLSSVIKDLHNTDFEKIINKVSSNSEMIIDNTFLKDDGK